MNRSRILSVSLLLASVAIAGSAPAFKSVSAKDRKFMRAACQGSMAEVKMGELAASRGQSDFVKSFGKRMVKDHGVALQEIRQLARTEKVALPKSINSEQKMAWNHLSGLHGEAFDKAYKMHMLEDHKMDTSEFKLQSKKANNSNVRNYAMKYAPIVEMHYKMLQDGKMDM